LPPIIFKPIGTKISFQIKKTHSNSVWKKLRTIIEVLYQNYSNYILSYNLKYCKFMVDNCGLFIVK